MSATSPRSTPAASPCCWRSLGRTRRRRLRTRVTRGTRATSCSSTTSASLKRKGQRRKGRRRRKYRGAPRRGPPNAAAGCGWRRRWRSGWWSPGATTAGPSGGHAGATREPRGNFPASPASLYEASGARHSVR